MEYATSEVSTSSGRIGRCAGVAGPEVADVSDGMRAFLSRKQIDQPSLAREATHRKGAVKIAQVHDFALARQPTFAVAVGAGPADLITGAGLRGGAETLGMKASFDKAGA
ncbi:MAG TPA: hypothetical protein VLJ86_15745, partial [Ramlibacter sp.]|nr:hypothetical protein [Ramlibacter sp.]